MKQGKLSIIIGRLKGKTSTTTQAFRYPKDEWTAAAARAHCKAQGGSFEAASGQTQEMDKDRYLDPIYNPFIKTDKEDE
jgi:hypothetical protein